VKNREEHNYEFGVNKYEHKKYGLEKNEFKAVLRLGYPLS